MRVKKEQEVQGSVELFWIVDGELLKRFMGRRKGIRLLSSFELKAKDCRAHSDLFCS